MKTLTRDVETGRFVTKVTCDSCETIRINGLVCHESGCPQAWRGEIRECKWCGTQFQPEARWQEYCSHSCFCSDNGLPCPEDEEAIEEAQ